MTVEDFEKKNSWFRTESDFHGDGNIQYDKHNTCIEHDRRLQMLVEFVSGGSNGAAVV